ncbi:MAG TPA: cysteine desulfurase family protein [Candidatus Paceibacterota bacterium]
MKSDKIYLDYASTTPIDRDVLEDMLQYFNIKYSNPSSMYDSGRLAKSVIDDSRKRIAKYINCKPEEIIFTGSGTEADNLAIKGIAREYKKEGNHIIISAIEHKAILEPAKQLEKEGFEVTILPVDKYGMIDVKQCISYIKKETILVSVMYANNEIGTIEPIKDLALAIKNHRGVNTFPLLHTDACQALGAISIDIDKLGVDLMSLNSSKIYGPKGVGMLYKKLGIKISPIISGGEQERNLRAGTENIALIHGFSVALEKACGKMEKESKRLIELREYFIKGLKDKIPDLKINGHLKKRLPNNIHVSIPSVEGESMLLMLDKYGVEVSTGSACSAFDLKPSHVLIAIHQDEEIIHGSVRFTLGRYTTKKDLSYVIKVFPPIVNRLKSLSAIKR